MRAKLLFVTLLSLTTAAATAAAGQEGKDSRESLYFLRRTGGYGAFEFGPGSFQLTCDSCSGHTWGSGGINFYLGHHFSRTWRAEIGVLFQTNRESGNHFLGGTLGASVYLLGHLHVRGGVVYLNPNIDDSLSNFTGKGFGFLAGAGYDLYLSPSLAITPFVSYSRASISKLTQTASGLTNQSSGNMHAFQFGISLTRLKVTYYCGSKQGRLWSEREYGFSACLDRVAGED